MPIHAKQSSDRKRIHFKLARLPKEKQASTFKLSGELVLGFSSGIKKKKNFGVENGGISFRKCSFFIPLEFSVKVKFFS